MTRTAAGLAIVSALACSGLGPTQHALDASDHAVLLEGAEVAAQFPGVTIDPTKEVWSKSYSLGSWDLEYTYETEGFYLTSLVTVHSTQADAETAMWAAGLATGMFGEDVRFEESADIFTGGDARRCGTLVSDVGTVGNFCLVRTGSVFAMLVLVGAAAEGPGGLDSLLGGPVAAMSGYTPKRAPTP